MGYRARRECIVDNPSAARSMLMRLHEAVERREPSRPEAALSPEDLLIQFRTADPTRNGSYLPWLLKTYVAGGYRLEDLGKAHDTLETFARFRQRLPITAIIDREVRNPRKLGSHVTLASLWSVIAPLIDAERLAKADETGDVDRKRALAQSQVLYRSDRMVVAVPLTKEASCWWGRGTQWCTAARNNNAFEKYYKDAPLIVVCLRKVGDLPARKLQLYVHAGSMQFMDENDVKVLPELVLERWVDLAALIHWALTQNGLMLQYVPESLRTEVICTGAIGSDGRALYYTPEHLRTEAICLLAVEQDGRALHYVPKPLRTQTICKAALGRNEHKPAVVVSDQRTQHLHNLALKSLENYMKNLYPNRCDTAMSEVGLNFGAAKRALHFNFLSINAFLADIWTRGWRYVRHS